MQAKVIASALPLLINAAVMAGCLLGSAGRWDWWRAWILIGLSSLTGAASSAAVRHHAGLAAERRAPGRGVSWDKFLVGCTVLLGPAATWIVAGLEVRHRGPAGLFSGFLLAGVVAALAGGALLAWAMSANAFFSSVIRIQQDRGHRVVTTGPYRFVRHPGYAGALLFLAGTPLVLGSRYALGPAALTAGLLVLRTALEDRLLQRELAGYADYAQRSRYRLVPLVW